MTADRYVNAIVKKIKCSGTKKKDIKRRLLADVNMRVEQGESIETVMNEMGSINEIAEGFNENISDKEKKSYEKGRFVKWTIIGVFLVVLIMCLIYICVFKSRSNDNRNPFHRKKIESAVSRTIENLDRGDYEALRKESISEMQTAFEEGTIESAKNMISDNWGKRESMGEVLIQEVIEEDLHFAITQVTVIYENVSVTYTITFDRDMKIAGIYMK